MVTTVWRSLRERMEKRRQPVEGLGASETPTSLGSTSMRTGTPGRAPLMEPVEGVSPSMVMEAPLSRRPDQVRTPEVGPE